ncbi:hypothetical protein BVX97_06080 [bacterium E08(2017)]|nr:hypothetical protein BVX97_06080 [bacterium E08(2017)]
MNAGTINCSSFVTIKGGNTNSAVLKGGDINCGGDLTFSSGALLTIAGTKQGSATFNDIGGTLSRININFMLGTRVKLTLTNPADTAWAETIWTNGQLKYNGQDYTTLGDWSTVTKWNALGGYQRFDFTSNTLSLAYDPPPAATSIIIR